jgi:transglutaminase-like putative cysteine protease
LHGLRHGGLTLPPLRNKVLAGGATPRQRWRFNFSPGYFMRVVWLLLGLLWTCAAGAQAYKTGAAPAWVVPLAAEPATPPTWQPQRGSVAYLLRDMQTRVDQRGKVTYVHVASKALDGGGVEKLANLSINFDPTYQSLTLHAINLIRAGKVIPKLPGAKVQLLQRETELDYLVYDGSKTASVLLDDVRIGDIVEYAFSLDGSNPVFRGKVTSRVDMSWSVPVDRSFARLLIPSSRLLRLVTHNSKLQPVVSEADGYRDYRWDAQNIAATKVDKGAPEWFNPYVAVQWTEFDDWASVVQWSLPLYQTPRAPGPALHDEIARIRREYSSAAGRAAAVLQLVQRDVRYLGIEVGPGSHAPTAPDKVYQRRFGDCKDKTLLTVTMLRALDIDAVPALVNTEITRDVANWAPTPLAFNHVLVRARIDGQVYWLDPTRSMQQGELAHLYQPDYGYALVLEPGSTALSRMALSTGSLKTIRAVFDSTAGVDQPVNYTIHTTVQGERADNLRRQLRYTRSDMETQYQNFYARRYEGIHASGGMDIKDDEALNELTTLESYRIPRFWVRDDKHSRSQAQVESSEIEEPLKAPEAISRNAPLRQEYPREIIEVTEVRLPYAWNIKTSETTVRDPAFEFSYKVTKGADSKSVLIAAHYKALRDAIEPGDMGNYAAHLKQARDAVGYSLYSSPDAGAASEKSETTQPVRRGWLVPVVAVLMLVTLAVLAQRMQQAPPAHTEVNRRLLLAGVLAAGLGVGCWMAPELVKVMPEVTMALLALLVRYLLRIVPTVPANHVAYPLALRLYRARDRRVPKALYFFQREMLPLLGWCAIGAVLARLVSLTT